MCIIFLGIILFVSLVRSTSIINEDTKQYGSIFTRSELRFQQEMLQAHNIYRALHCAPSLRLDDDLSREAQYHAEQLAKSNGWSRLDTNGAGQNLFTKSSSAYLGSVHGREAVALWYKGAQHYNFKRGGFSMKTGTFTQLVWADSQRLGVGIAYTNDRRTAYIVAQYIPPGNYENDYQENVFPARC